MVELILATAVMAVIILYIACQVVTPNGLRNLNVLNLGFSRIQQRARLPKYAFNFPYSDIAFSTTLPL